jgi:hypothetical protein
MGIRRKPLVGSEKEGSWSQGHNVATSDHVKGRVIEFLVLCQEGKHRGRVSPAFV